MAEEEVGRSGLQPSGLRPFGAEPAAQSQAKPLVPNAGDLFGEPEDPPAPKRELDLRTEYLKERYGLPDEWVWCSFESIDPPTYEHSIYKGGVYPFAITKGKHKGRTNYRKPLPGTERTCVINGREFEVWLPTWEAKTGKCHECRGTGQRWIGWNAAEGNRHCDCERCGATGNAPASRIEARRAETPQEVPCVAREPDPKGDAQRTPVSRNTTEDEAERVARAIFEEEHRGLSNCLGWDDCWEDGEHHRERYRRNARAAISAMTGESEG